ncbi:MAG TPA: hypothetical protein VE954_32885 [Oligoflexus sp.]|nr:hypothetical protein [Oligoflexus sp.]
MGIVLGLALGLQACNDAGFQSGRTLADDKAATSAPGDSTGTSSGDATAGSFDQIPAKVETTSISDSKRPDTMISSFQAATTVDASFKFKIEPNSVKTDFTLEENLVLVKDTYSQTSRNLLTDSFTQGNSGTPVKEEFDQKARQGLADILIVIDNSGSMKEEQVNLSTKLNELLVSIKDANWQISVINTSPVVPAGVTLTALASEGKELCNTTVIKAGEVDATEKFAAAVNAGISGNGNEQGIRQAVVGLRCTEKPWVRPASTLAVLIVSDEDNCSIDGTECGTLPWAKETYLQNYVETTLQRTIGKNAGFYGIVAPSKALCSTAGNAGTQYLRLFDYKSTAGANYGNICDASYKTTLNRISDSIALQLNNQVELTTLPDTNTLALTLQLVDGTTQALDPASYTLTGKVITFLPGKEPPTGSKVVANYKAGAQPQLTSFTLSQDPAVGTVVAKINGAMATPGSYTASGRVVTFTQAPAAMAKITLDYLENKALLDRFKTTATALPDSIKVTVNGQATTNFTFDAARSEVVLKTLPADGQAIEIAYNKSNGPKLVYTLPVSKDSRNVKIMDQGTPISFTQSGNSFTISADAYLAGKVLTLSYDLPDGSTKVFEIGRMPIPGSADIVDSIGGCDLGTGLDILDDKLISTCALGTAMDFSLTYKYLETLKVFKVNGVENPELGNWTVYVDGISTKDYVRSGSSITLNSELAADARIDIHYTLPE